MSLEVQGLQELLNNIRQMGFNVDTRLEEKALKAGANVIEDEIKSEANRIRDDGTLHDNIDTTDVKNGIITVHTGGAYHAHLVEFGRSAGQGTYIDKNGVTRPVKWGDTTPQPVVQGSFERKKDEAFEEMKKVIKRELGL